MKNKIISVFGILVLLGGLVLGGIGIKRCLNEANAGESYEELKVELDIPPLQEIPDAEEKLENPIDFKALKAKYPDVYAWIRIPGTKVDYPIAQRAGEDADNYYLHHTIDGRKRLEGAIYTESLNSKDFTDPNTVIYGHNMKNGSMFGQLRKFKAKDYYEQNPYFYIYTPDGKEVKYQVYAVCIVEDTSDSYNKFYENDDAYLKYLQYIKGIARYDTGVKVTAQTQLVSLSTCTNVTETQRLLVHGVKVEEPVAEGQVNETPVEEKAVE